MLKILAAAAIANFSTAPAPVSKAPAIELAAQCFKTGEQQSGNNRICTYKCFSGDKSITIGAMEMCPMSIND